MQGAGALDDTKREAGDRHGSRRCLVGDRVPRLAAGHITEPGTASAGGVGALASVSAPSNARQHDDHGRHSPARCMSARVLPQLGRSFTVPAAFGVSITDTLARRPGLERCRCAGGSPIAGFRGGRRSVAASRLRQIATNSCAPLSRAQALRIQASFPEPMGQFAHPWCLSSVAAVDQQRSERTNGTVLYFPGEFPKASGDQHEFG